MGMATFPNFRFLYLIQCLLSTFFPVKLGVLCLRKGANVNIAKSPRNFEKWRGLKPNVVELRKYTHLGHTIITPVIPRLDRRIQYFLEMKMFSSFKSHRKKVPYNNINTQNQKADFMPPLKKF